MDEEEKIRELEALNSQIADASTIAISLQNEITKKTIQLIDQTANLIETKTKRSASLFNPQIPEHFDISDLPSDYIDHIKEKNDELNKLQIDHEESEKTLNNRMKEIDILIQTQSELMVELSQNNSLIFEQEIINIPLKKDTNLFQQNIKEYDILIKEANQICMKTETALSTSDQRMDNFDLKGGGIVDLQNSISNINDQIKLIDESIEEGLKTLNKYQDEDFNEQLQFDQNMNNLKTLYSWDSQKAEAQKELNGIKESTIVNKTQLTKYQASVQEKENRLSILIPIVAKHDKTIVEKTQLQQTDIDLLIKQLKKCSKDNKSTRITKRDVLTTLIQQNSELEKRKESRNREFQHSTTKFIKEVQIMKRKIDETRNYTSEKEHTILETIKELEVKLNKSISNIPSAKTTAASISDDLIDFTSASSKQKTINPCKFDSPNSNVLTEVY